MDDAAWIALSLLPHVGSKTLRNLITHFETAEGVLSADTAALQKVPRIGAKIAQSIQTINLIQTRRDIASWQQTGIVIAPSYSPTYPPILHDIDDEPATLFMYGDYLVSGIKQAVAIVGTRNPSAHARQLAFRAAATLTRQGWTVVSGLALGIDTAAHSGALSVPQSKTIAVLGSGVLNVYPEQNKTLAARIMKRGALVSENHPHATPKAARLVSRNRIIAGLCQHVIVVESASNGGAMYAANAATTQGRTLHTFDLPASGNQALITRGANILNIDALQL